MPKDSPGRIPTLDGIRALAIGLVFVGHLQGTPPLPDIVPLRYAGTLGVHAFFILSGFLITTLLLREHAKHGRISLRGFFARRVFRIFPAFFTYVGVMTALIALGVIAVPWSELVIAATYLMNFITPESWWVGHLWSLAVEEQFYLLWPLAMVLASPSRKRWITIAGAAVVIALLVRFLGNRVFDDLGDIEEHGFPFVFDALAIGCLLALLRDRLEANPTYMRLVRSPLLYVAVVGISVLFIATVARPTLAAPIISLLNVLYAMWMHRVISNPTSPMGRFLERTPLVWIGTLSYSLYLWQQPFVNRPNPSWMTVFPLSIVLSVIAACASYYLVEQPVLNWRARVKARA
ncbi:MAG: acyltransferase [Proteobacteria bacterium]|nr:acyltransferase [Pseudomonadota bacterium]